MTEKDTVPDLESGTKVREVDASGQNVQGVLGGKAFRTVSWSVRARQQKNAGCPTWLKTVVVSDSLKGAKLGAGLAGENEVPASSSFSSRDVEAIVVDGNGVEKMRFKVPYALVRALKPSTVPPIAAELWFSQQPFDTSKTPVATMENRCKQE